MRHLGCLVVGACLLGPLPAAAEELSEGMSGEEMSSLADLIGTELGNDPGLDGAWLEPEDQKAWALRELLQRGFAQSLTPQARIERWVAEELELEASRRWLEGIDRQAHELALRGGTYHHTGQNEAGLVFDIPLADHPLVDVYIDYFTGRGRWFFEVWLERADRYIPLMQPILAKKGVPIDTVYLAMIESGFSSKAYSTAAASGFWQFIESTGRSYGLRNDTWVDERRDFEKATESAANYLLDLHREFKDWQLAWAGYNAGAGRIRRALAKYEGTTFWDLVEHRRSLAKETHHYVPKLIAAALIAKDRTRYGFPEAKVVESLTWDCVEVPDAVDIRVVAEHLDVPFELMRDLNPALRHDITPPGRPYTLRVPVGRADETAAWIETMPRAERLAYRSYRVQRGDSLSKIAKRFGSSTQAIMEFNRLASAHRLSMNQELIIPELADAPSRRRSGRVVRASVYGAERAPKSRPRAGMERIRDDESDDSRTIHTVAAGDTLWSIAQRYGVTVDWIKRKNNRRGNAIGVGEVLRIN